MPDLWRCPRCTLEKDPDDFYADRPGLAGALFWCKPCVTAFLKYHREKRRRRLDKAA